MFSGADLAALVNEAAITAVLKKRDSVLQEDLEEARDKVRFGRQKRSRVIADEDRIVIARHEAGHAVVSALIPGAEPVHKITIIPRGMALGATMFLPEKDRLDYSKKRAEAALSVAYGGRVAEELTGDDISAGAANDIAHATELARTMVCEWGFSTRVGPVRYTERTGSEFLGTELTAGRFHSEETARVIDEEVKRICDGAYQRTKSILETHRADLERVTQALLQYETITGAELKALLAGQGVETLRPPAPAPAPPPAPAPAVKARPEPRPSRGPSSLPDAGLAPA
jgi:cell division protease FtsH